LTQLAAADIEVTADLGNSGRTVVRFSGTELKLRLMVEAETTEMVTAALDKLQDAACADGILS
jgi:phosphomannomutase